MMKKGYKTYLMNLKSAIVLLLMIALLSCSTTPIRPLEAPKVIEIATTVSYSDEIDIYLIPTLPEFDKDHTGITFADLKRRYYLSLQSLGQCNLDKQSIKKITTPRDEKL